jgi:thiol:disulfide interchange protein DsbD
LAVWLGAFDSLGPDPSGRRRTAKAAGLAVALYGIVLGLGAASGGHDPLRPLGNLVPQRGGGGAEELVFRMAGTPTELRSQLAADDGKPSVLYVTAEWCVTCAAIERGVFRDPTVQVELGRFNLIKLDVSKNTPEQRQIMQSLQVVGPPTMIFVNAEGREPAGTRLVGDVTTTTLQASAARTGSAQ